MTPHQRFLKGLLLGYIAVLFAISPVAVPLWNGGLSQKIGLLLTIEQIHIAQYLGLGIVACLWALSTRQPRRLFFLVALVGTVGLLDEIVQAFLPQRFFQWSDVALNWMGGLLGFIPVGFPWGLRRLAQQGIER